MAEGVFATLWAPIVKTISHDDGTVTVRGKVSTEAVDYDDQIVDRGLMKKLLPRYIEGFANVRVGHDGHWPAGKAIGLEWDEDGDPVITARVVEPDAVRLVREGVLQGYSVNIKDPRVRPDPKARRGRIYDGSDLGEVSLVDRPSCPEAQFDVVKAAGYSRTPVPAPHDDPAVPTGWLSSDTARTRGGNVRDPLDSNSGDFDSMGDPILQPGHVRSDAADISIVTITADGAVVRVGDDEYMVPYTVESDGMVHWQEPVPLPHDPRAEPLPPQTAARTTTRKAAADMGVPVIRDDADKAVWSTEYVDDLPDSCFAYVEPGEKKDGRTQPVSKRHLPYKDKDGKVDAAHVRDALARLDQTEIPAGAKAEAHRKLEDAAKEVGVDVSKGAKVTDIRKAAAKHVAETVHCAECGKRVKCSGEAVKREKAPGGHHAVYKGECGHMVHRFEPEEKTAGAEPPEANDGLKAAAEHGEHAERHTREAEEHERAGRHREAAESHDHAAEHHGHLARHHEERGEREEAERHRKEAERHHEAAERHRKEAEKGVETGLGPDAGAAKGNTEGRRPEHTDQPERQEDDLIRRMRKALDDYEAAHRAEAEGKGGEGGETAALGHLSHDVGAAQQVQRREEGGKGIPDGVRGQDDEARDAEKVAAAMLGLLGYSRSEIRKAARSRRKAALRDLHKRLGEHIEEIPDDPLEHHPAGTDKAAFGEGRQRDPENAPERNDGGPAPARSGRVTERIRETVREIDELARDLEESEDPLVKEGGRPGRLVQEGPRSEMPRRLPAGPRYDLARGDGADEPPSAGSNPGLKGAGFTPPRLAAADMEALLTRVAAVAAKSAAEAVGAPLAQMGRTLDAVAHTVRPPRPPVAVAEPSAEYASPWQQTTAEKAAREQIGERWNALPPTDQDQLLARIIAHSRAGQRRPA